MVVHRRAKLLQSCPALYDPIDCSPSGSSVHGVLQARILEWVAIPSSRGSSQPRDWIHVSYRLLHWQVGSLPVQPLLISKGTALEIRYPGNAPMQLLISTHLYYTLEKAMAPHSSTLAWKIPWTEEPDRSLRVGHD